MERREEDDCWWRGEEEERSSEKRKRKEAVCLPCPAVTAGQAEDSDSCTVADSCLIAC